MLRAVRLLKLHMVRSNGVYKLGVVIVSVVLHLVKPLNLPVRMVIRKIVLIVTVSVRMPMLIVGPSMLFGSRKILA